MSSRPHPTRDLALVAVFAAFVAVSALVPGFAPVGGVPFTLQSLAVLLAGMVLGARRGFLALLLYLLLGTIGLPVFANGASGLGVFAGGSGGYLVAFPLAAALTGFVVERSMRLGAARALPLAFVAGALGVAAVMFPIGALGIALNTPFDVPASFAAAAAFIPLDLLKAAIAASVAVAVHRAFPGLLATPRATTAPARETIDA